jgi:hypothetical protein
MTPSMMLKKRIIDEVKMIIAGKKILKAMMVNQRLLDSYKDRYMELIQEASIKIQQSMIKWYYK